MHVESPRSASGAGGARFCGTQSECSVQMKGLGGAEGSMWWGKQPPARFEQNGRPTFANQALLEESPN